MISRRTIYALLLTLLLALCIHLWATYQRDDCDRLGPGVPGTPASVLVESGTRTLIVPCTYWIPRQSMHVQALLLFNLVLGVVFLISAATDWARTKARHQ